MGQYKSGNLSNFKVNVIYVGAMYQGLPMSIKRSSDSEPGTFFRSDRFFQETGKWYFLTREGTVEGPFDDPAKAKDRLESYIKVVTSGMINVDSELAIESTSIVRN